MARNLATDLFDDFLQLVGDGGEGGIRTHGTHKVQQFSRLPDSTTLAPHHNVANVLNFGTNDKFPHSLYSSAG